MWSPVPECKIPVYTLSFGRILMLAPWGSFWQEELSGISWYKQATTSLINDEYLSPNVKLKAMSYSCAQWVTSKAYISSFPLTFYSLHFFPTLVFLGYSSLPQPFSALQITPLSTSSCSSLGAFCCVAFAETWLCPEHFLGPHLLEETLLILISQPSLLINLTSPYNLK